MVYTSKQNPIIKEIASLKDKKYRQKLGLYVAEGVKLVNEAIKYNVNIEKIVVTEEYLPLVAPNNFNVIVVSKAVFDYLSYEESPQGVLAVIKIPSSSVLPPKGNALILDGVSDPGNLGTIIRTACAFDFKDIYMLNCTDAYSGKVVRASMSGVYFARLYKCDKSTLLKALEGYKIIVADMGGDSIDNFDNNYDKFAILVGNEANGVSRDMKELADKIISIPMQENVESLNVAVASAIMMYKLKR